MRPAGTQSYDADGHLVGLILEAAVEGIVFVTDDKTVAYINQAGREILHCSREDNPFPTFAELTALLGFDPLAVTFEPPASPKFLNGPEGDKAVQDVMNQRSLSRHFWHKEATIFNVPYLVRGSPISSSPTHSGGTVLYFKDMREIQQREQIISENIAFASHELLTPLTAIKNALDLLDGQRLGDLSDQQLKFLKLASRNVDRLNNVMTAVLDLSQLETQTLALNLEEISVVEPLERALAALEYLAQEKGVEVKRQLQGRYPRILADPDRLRQVVYNLVHNAIKFTSEGGIVRVSLEAVPRANLPERLPSDGTVKLPEYSGKQSLLFTVADDGEGIPTTFIRSIFNKFSQGPSADPNTRGSGLGLAIVKALVEAHGGAVWVESEPGEGSRFQVVLPELSRKEHLVRTTEATLERAKTTFASLTLVILKVVPIIRGAVSDAHQREEMNNLLQKVVETTRNTVRLKGDRVEILDPSLGILSLLAAISPEDVPALLRRVTSTLKQQTKEKGQSLNLQLVWGMASYPKDVSTAAELIAAALKAIAGAGAEVINLGQR